MPLSKLNSQQHEAASASFGSTLVIASAGTGKTSTIVARIAYLLSQGISPESIVLLTFTNKAAAEMVERIALRFGHELAGKIEAGTFHALSYKWLKRWGENVILKETKELKTLLRSIHERHDFARIGAQAVYSANYLFDLISLFKNTLHSSFGDWIVEKNPDQEPNADIYEHIYTEYEEQKRRFGFADFNDLLLLMKEALERYKPELTEILVDEYQDTNLLQCALIDAFPKKSLFCVGDYDQSIYAFNGAQIGIITSFDNRYPNAKIFTLTKNYRSTAPILELANRVIAHNERIFPKHLEVVRTDAPHIPKLLAYDELFEQYQAIAHQISRSLTPATEIAVLFRNNASADGIEACLRELAIPCKRRGGVSFFDTKEVNAVLNVLAFIINPKDLLAFITLFDHAPHGLGSATAREIGEALLKLGPTIKHGLLTPIPFEGALYAIKASNTQLGLFDDFEYGKHRKLDISGLPSSFAAHPAWEHPRLNTEGLKFIYDITTLLKEVPAHRRASWLVTSIIDSPFFSRVKTALAKARATTKNGYDPKKNDEALEKIDRKMSLLCDLSTHYADPLSFLNALTLGSKEMSEGEGINLLSVHASKGLEFEEVYIIDLMDGRFPNNKLAASAGGIEEERRLFYVAATRAKVKLHLSFARYDKIRKTEHLPSRFLTEAGFVF